MKVIRNTYPKHSEHPNVPRAEVGDEVVWEVSRSAYRLVRQRDGKHLFATAPVNKDGMLYSTKQPPQLTGIIAQVESKGWLLEIG